MSDQKKGGIQIDGMKEAAELLAGLDPQNRERILKEIALQNPPLADQLRKDLFHFDQVLALPPIELLKVIQAVPQDLIVLSLRGLEPRVLENFFKGFSERQGKIIREEMLAQGPRKLSDVQLAQERIIEVARTLHEKGEINLKR